MSTAKLSAMISSTALDLPLHRKAAMEACVAAEVLPIGMEHLPARDATGVTVSLEMVDKADIYIGIYAFRYGWVPDGSPVSITEMEFDRAVARKDKGEIREILIFAAHKEHPITAGDVEADKDAQQKLAAFKTRASNGRIRKEFKSVEELRRLISEALADLKARTTSPQPAVHNPKTLIPHNLPRLQPFFGRKDELRKIADALDPESRTWGALIDGPGGMGKTSLAVRAAYECTPEQFERIVFVSIKDRELDDDGVRTLGNLLIPGLLELLNELARELGHPDIPKSAEDQRTRLLLDALRGTRTLLILDNLEDLLKAERDQIFTFVKKLPQGCKAILTSRRRIGSSADTLVLEKLDQAAALETLADLAMRIPLLQKTSEAERIALYTQTGGKPLLLRWVVGQLGRGSCRTFTDALAFLRSCPKDNDPLEFIFGDLADEFTPDETKLLCALTYFSLPAKVEHIRDVADPVQRFDDSAESAQSAGSSPQPLTLEAADTALRTLANRSLVTADDEENSYVLGPLVADFLRKHRPEVVRETGTRLEQRAFALIVENGDDNHDRFPLLDAAWPTVAPAIPVFLAGENARLQTVCAALRTFLEFTGRWDEWLSLNQQAEAKALAAGDHAKAAWRAYHAGMVHYLRQQVDAVLACADRATAHWHTAKAGAREQATAIGLRGLGHRLNRDYPAAITANREALELWRSLSGESKDVAIGMNALASTEQDSGDFAAAERDYREALRVARVVRHDESVATYTGNLAWLALEREDWPGAEALAREALPLSEKVGRQELIAWDCYVLAHALVRQGKAAEALPHAERAVAILTRLGTPNLTYAQRILDECRRALAAPDAP